MPKIDRASLMPLETYAKERNTFRAKVMAHKKHRQIALGAHLTLSFEDELSQILKKELSKERCNKRKKSIDKIFKLQKTSQ